MSVEYPTVLDPGDDCPDKLIWMLYGWLAFDDDPWIYEEALRELHRMLVCRIEDIDQYRAHEKKGLAEAAE